MAPQACLKRSSFLIHPVSATCGNSLYLIMRTPTHFISLSTTPHRSLRTCEPRGTAPGSMVSAELAHCHCRAPYLRSKKEAPAADHRGWPLYIYIYQLRGCFRTCLLVLPWYPLCGVDTVRGWGHLFLGGGGLGRKLTWPSDRAKPWP